MILQEPPEVHVTCAEPGALGVRQGLLSPESRVAGRRLREPHADAEAAGGRHRRPRPSARVPRRRHSGGHPAVRQRGRPGFSRRQGWHSGRPAGRQSGRCLGAIRRVARERDRPRVGAGGAHLRVSSGRTQGSRDRDPERSCNSSRRSGGPWRLSRPSSATRTGTPSNAWASCSASSPSRSRRRSRRRTGPWPR